MRLVAWRWCSSIKISYILTVLFPLIFKNVLILKLFVFTLMLLHSPRVNVLALFNTILVTIKQLIVMQNIVCFISYLLVVHSVQFWANQVGNL